jgi:hypothetical protein
MVTMYRPGQDITKAIVRPCDWCGEVDLGLVSELGIADPDDGASSWKETVEQLQRRCAEALSPLRDRAIDGAVGAVDEDSRSLNAVLQHPQLPRDFVDQVRAELKGINLLVNMKATDMALRRAVVHAKADCKLERNQDIASARGFLGRAMALGAKEDFKRAAEMTIESVLLTGGIKQTGPTRTKPIDDAPAPRDLAKDERRGS